MRSSGSCAALGVAAAFKNGRGLDCGTPFRNTLIAAMCGRSLGAQHPCLAGLVLQVLLELRLSLVELSLGLVELSLDLVRLIF